MLIDHHTDPRRSLACNIPSDLYRYVSTAIFKMILADHSTTTSYLCIMRINHHNDPRRSLACNILSDLYRYPSTAIFKTIRADHSATSPSLIKPTQLPLPHFQLTSPHNRAIPSSSIRPIYHLSRPASSRQSPLHCSKSLTCPHNSYPRITFAHIHRTPCLNVASVHPPKNPASHFASLSLHSPHDTAPI